jgi:methylmalonyl-CoA mutase cobalamin-binding subunit
MRLIGLAVILALAIALAPIAAEAQQSRVYRVGVLVLGGPHSSTIDGLRDGLRELGSRRASSSSSTCVIPKAM